MEPASHNWICEDTETHLCDFLDGTLVPGMRAGMESHAAVCAGCASKIAAVGGLVHQLQKLDPLETPPQLTASILAATLGPRRGPSRWGAWVEWLRPIARPSFAYGAVSLLVTAMVISQAFGLQWNSSGVSTLNPLTLFHAANRQAHQMYARSEKMVSDLRLVYEIQTRLHPDEEIEQTEETPVEAPGGAADEGPRQPQKFRASEKILNISTHRSGAADPFPMPGRIHSRRRL